MSNWHVRNIVNDIQTIHQIHLSGEAWDKVRQGVNGAVQRDRENITFERDMYQRLHLEYKKENYEVRHNELVQWLKREIFKHPQHAEVFSYVLFTMQKLKDDKSVR